MSIVTSDLDALLAKTIKISSRNLRCGNYALLRYPTGRKISDEKMKRVNVVEPVRNFVRNAFHGEWNYVIKPNTIKVS